MKKLKIGNGELTASEIALGLMRISGMAPKEAETLVGTALDEGIDFFDNADIYGGGKSEEVFAQALAAFPGAREKILIQSKCSIRNDMFDFSKEYILEAVEGSLRRLRTDYQTCCCCTGRTR
jgi:predicted oxidoreductase